MMVVMASSKRSTADTQGQPRKRRRSSLANVVQNGYTSTANLFELQVDELLKGLVSEADSNIEKVTSLLKRLKDTIESLPAQKPMLPREADVFLRSTANVITPFFMQPPKDAKYTLEFGKPAAINVIGSVASGTLLERDRELVADMLVVMPKQIFQEKDYRKHRYFHKKAYYTASIAVGLMKAKLSGLSFSFSLQNGNSLQPCVLVRSLADSMPSVTVRIICTAPSGLFAEAKLLPWINNLSTDGDKSVSVASESTITPLYNSTLRSEMLSLTYLSLIHKVSKETTALRKAALLFSIWLRQRGFGTDLLQGGFGSFEARALMAIMLYSDPGQGNQPMFRTRYDHHQLFKATLILLASKDFVANPVSYDRSKDKFEKPTVSQTLRNMKKDVIQESSALFFDGDRSHNLLFKMSPWSYARLRRQAEITVKCLNSNDNERFSHCFISNLSNSVTQYDQVIELVPNKLKASSKDRDLAHEPILHLTNSLYRTLKHGLGDRAQEVAFRSERQNEWDVSQERAKGNKLLYLNLVLEPSQAARLQDLGPSAENKEEAASFRQFWGPKAELRRFRDGSIQETVVWDDHNSENIVTQIVRYLLTRHHSGEKHAAMDEVGPSLWNHLPQPEQSRSLIYFDKVFQTYRSLEQTIRGLKMPLNIRQVSPASSGLRNTSLMIDTSTRLQPLLVVLQFESSGQWPDDLGAIQQVKIAFLQKLADLLSQHDTVIQTRVGIGQHVNNKFFRPFLEVLTGTLCFHVILYHDRESHLLKSSPSNSIEERRVIIPELNYHNTMFLRVPAHTQRVRDLCTQFPLLSQSIRLFKAWCSIHLLTSHFKEELLELFVIHTFTQPGPYGSPSSLRTAFLRTIAMLSKWDWHNEPLFVPMNDDADQKPTEQLDTHFEAWRKLDPSLTRVALVVGSNIDPNGTAWTEQTPSKMVAARLTSLAKVAHSTVMKHDLELDSELLFSHSLKDYDFVIHLQSKVLKIARNDMTKAINGYTDELKRVFGDTLVWFHAAGTPKVIAGLWNPTVQSKRWKVNLGYSTIPMSESVNDNGDSVTARCNTKSIINEIVRLGGDLVKEVSIKDGTIST